MQVNNSGLDWGLRCKTAEARCLVGIFPYALLARSLRVSLWAILWLIISMVEYLICDE
jgi:hypothetical protein